MKAWIIAKSGKQQEDGEKCMLGGKNQKSEDDEDDEDHLLDLLDTFLTSCSDR